MANGGHGKSLMASLLAAVIAWTTAAMRTTAGESSAGGDRYVVRPVPLSSVRLLSRASPHALAADSHGILQRHELNLAYLGALDPQKLACPFVTASSWLGNQSVSCVDYTENRGHWFQGHYLSATSHALATADDATIASRAEEFMKLLEPCQRADGYLGAWPSGVFDDLEAGRRLRSGVSVPYYDVHKMLAGLLDRYTLLSDGRALRMAVALADYFVARVRNVIRVNGMATWQRILCVEWGGMNEAAYNLYAITKNESHRELGDYFEKQAFALPLSAGVDALSGLHANTHIPQVIGMARGYEVTGNVTQRRMAQYIFDTVFHTRAYATGNGNPHEHWWGRNLTGSRCEIGDTVKDPSCIEENVIAARTEEGCTTYNMQKLARHLYFWSGAAKFMDYYELTFFSSLLSHINGVDGRKLYYLPLGVLPQPPSTGQVPGLGFQKLWMDPFSGFLCCQGTMTESAAKLVDSTYQRAANDTSTVYVSQFLSSVLDVAGLHVEQVSAFPESRNHTTSLRVSCEVAKSIVMQLRVPGWADSGENRVLLDGQLISTAAHNGSYLPLRLACRPVGQQIDVHYPMTLRLEHINDARQQFVGVFAVLYGPILLAALSNSSYVPAAAARTPPTSWIQRRDAASSPQHITDIVGMDGLVFYAKNVSGGLGGFWMVPLSKITTQYYAMYLNATDSPIAPPLPSPPPPPRPPAPPAPPPSPPGPPCVVNLLTNDTDKLNNYCRSHGTVQTGQLCSYLCGPGDWRVDRCLSTGWETSVAALCANASAPNY